MAPRKRTITTITTTTKKGVKENNNNKKKNFKKKPSEQINIAVDVSNKKKIQQRK